MPASGKITALCAAAITSAFLLIGACDAVSPIYTQGAANDGAPGVDAQTETHDSADTEDVANDEAPGSDHQTETSDSTDTKNPEPAKCSVPTFFSLENGQVYEYEYEFTSGGGQGSGEDRASGTLTWTVSTEYCSNGIRSLTINEDIKAVSEFRTFVGENQDWQRRGTIEKRRSVFVSISDQLFISDYLLEPVTLPSVGGESDTLMVAQSNAKESYTLEFIPDIGVARATHWEMHGLGGPSEKTTITLVGIID